MVYQRKTFECVECHRRVPYVHRNLRDYFQRNYAGEDVEASGMCDRCQDEIESRAAIIAARYERRGIILSNDAIMFLTNDL